MFLHLRVCFYNNIDLSLPLYLFEVEHLLREISETVAVSEHFPFSAFNKYSLYLACRLMLMIITIFKLV